MKVTEELVTVELASHLSRHGWRIVSVHPPGGQGPFVIPRVATGNKIARRSFHPDVVAVQRVQGVTRIMLAEAKPTRQEMESDVLKLQELVASPGALLFAMFRCQAFEGGPADGVDFDAFQAAPDAIFPIDFIIASAGPTFEERERNDLQPYRLTEVVFATQDVLKRASVPAHN